MDSGAVTVGHGRFFRSGRMGYGGVSILPPGDPSPQLTLPDPDFTTKMNRILQRWCGR